MGPRLDNLEATLSSITQAHAEALGLVHGEQNANAAFLNQHAIQRGMAHQQQALGYVPPTYVAQTANSFHMANNGPSSVELAAERRIRALEERLRGIVDSCPDCDCADENEEAALLDDYERRFCLESDYADDDECHPVGSALVRMQTGLRDARQELARHTGVGAEMVEHRLECPFCRRDYGCVTVPVGVGFQYDVRCKGCELEGRR